MNDEDRLRDTLVRALGDPHAELPTAQFSEPEDWAAIEEAASRIAKRKAQRRVRAGGLALVIALAVVGFGVARVNGPTVVETSIAGQSDATAPGGSTGAVPAGADRAAQSTSTSLAPEPSSTEAAPPPILPNDGNMTSLPPPFSVPSTAVPDEVVEPASVPRPGPPSGGDVRATWNVDSPLSASTTTFDVLVRSSACSSAEGATFRSPVVLETAEAVVVTFDAVAPPPTDESVTCGSSVPVRRTVTLPSPLGSRWLYDGGLEPPNPVWRPGL